MNSNECNPYLRRLDEIAAARKKWAESEWLLTLLRSDNGTKPHVLSDEELLQWSKNLH